MLYNVNTYELINNIINQKLCTQKILIYMQN